MPQSDESEQFIEDWSVDLEDAKLKEVLAYWQRKRVGAAPPRRSDIDPNELRALLPYVFLMDVLPGLGDFRYRLMGSEIVHMAGENVTAKTTRSVFPSNFLRFVLLAYRAVAGRQVPLRFHGRFWLRRLAAPSSGGQRQ